MQAIARANRVYPGKSAGIIVDYVNVFKYMKKALTEYATGDDGTEFPAKDIDQLISYIDGTIDEADSFLLSLDIDLKKIIADSNTLDKLDALRSAYDTIVAKDGDKEKFKVILNTLTNLYEASKPEIFEKNWSNDKFAPLVYLHGLFYHTIDDEKVARARQKMNQILDGRNHHIGTYQHEHCSQSHTHTVNGRGSGTQCRTHTQQEYKRRILFDNPVHHNFKIIHIFYSFLI